MIHAMISDRTSRQLATMPGPDPGFTMNCASYVAESEARRVLAVAEPGDGRRVPAFRVEWGAAPTWARADASLDAGAPYFLALAEALSAFVGADDPAEYLEVRQ